MSDQLLHILIVEDEDSIRRFLRATLTAEGYALTEVVTGTEALEALDALAPDLVILDIGLPDMSGVELLRRTRGRLHVPVIVLSALGSEEDKVAALDAGADDYLTKPFGVKELLARIRVAQRNASRRFERAEEEAMLTIAELAIDRERRRVSLRGEPIHLTPIEYKLLVLLATHAGRVLTHRFLLDEVWGHGEPHEVQYLRVFMAGLRRKLEENPAQPRYLLTEPGVGYRLADE